MEKEYAIVSMIIGILLIVITRLIYLLLRSMKGARAEDIAMKRELRRRHEHMKTTTCQNTSLAPYPPPIIQTIDFDSEIIDHLYLSRHFHAEY